MTRHINAAGLALLKAYEDCVLTAYPDPGNRPPKGDGTPWTCGYGSTGPDIGPSTVFTQAEAERRLEQHLRKVELEVSRLVKVPISDNQYSALCCLAYNIGTGRQGLAGSTLLRRLNGGLAADTHFGSWVYSHGVLLRGLVRRRAAERALFLSPDQAAPHALGQADSGGTRKH